MGAAGAESGGGRTREAPAEGGEGLNGGVPKKHDAAEKRGDKKTDAIPTEREILGGAKSFEDKKFIE